MDRDMRRRLVVVSAILLFIGVLIGLIVTSKVLFDTGVTCIFYELLHWNCPGCGATRMAVCIIHGDFYGALKNNAFVFLTSPMMFIVMMYQVYQYVRYNKLVSWIDKFLVIYISAFIAFAIIRNIPGFEFLLPIPE